jgi:hypothetical protein
MYRDLRESGASQRLAFGIATRNERANCSVSSNGAAGHVNLSVTPPPPYLFIDPALVPARGFNPDALSNDQSQDAASLRANASNHLDSLAAEDSSFLSFDRPANPALLLSPDFFDIPISSLLESQRPPNFPAPSDSTPRSIGSNLQHLPSACPPRSDIPHIRQDSPEIPDRDIHDNPSSRSSSPTLPSLDEESHNVFANGLGSGAMSSPGVLPGNTRYTLLWSGIQGATTPPTPTPVRPLRIKRTKSKSEGGLSMRRDILPLSKGPVSPSIATAERPSEKTTDTDVRSPAASTFPYWSPAAAFSGSHASKAPLRVTNSGPGSVSDPEEKPLEQDMDSASVDEQEVSFTATNSASSSIVDLQSAIFQSALTRGRSRTRSAVGQRHTLPNIIEEVAPPDGALNEGQSSDYFRNHRRSTSSTITIRGQRTAILLTHLNLQAERRRAGIYSTSTMNTKQDMTLRLHSLDVDEEMHRSGHRRDVSV